MTASFTTPKDGDTVEQTSNVQVTLARRGTAVNVGSAKLQIRGPGATEFGTSRDGVTDGANATFSGVQLQPGENALRATVVEANCTNSVPAVTIVVTAKNNVTPPPVVLGCDFPQDTNTDGVLNATELPAGQAVSVRVRTQNGAGATFSAPNSSPASAPIMNETATLTVPGPTADGTFAVTGTVTRGTGMPTCNASIRVQRTAGCAIENTTDQSVRGPMSDADTMTAGFQIRATASRTTGMASTATLRMGNETRTINLNSAATASADFTVGSTGTQSYMVTLEGADAAGNPCMVVNATRTVSVDFDPPTVAITVPMAADGGALVTRAPVAVTATVGAADNGATACAFVGTTQVDCGTVANGSVTLSVPFGSDGFRTIEVRVTDAAGNTASARVDVNVVLSGCGVAFYVPPTNPALVNASQAPGGNYTVRTASKATCVGQPVRLSRAAVSADGGVGAFTQIGNGTLTLRSLPDGGSDAVSAFTSMVSNGDFVFHAEVDNFGDGGIDQSNVDVTVDLDGPVITSPVVPSGQMRANINTSQDSSSTTPGAQRVLSFNARVPMGGRVDLCTTQNTGTMTPECGAGFFRLATNLVSPVTSFTFPEGSYDLKIVVIGGGNTIESPVVPVTVDVSRPCIVASTLRATQDANTDSRLNIVELGAAAPRLEFQLDSACGDANLSTLSTTAGVVVREVVGGVPSAALNLPADVTFDGTAMRVRVNLTQSVSNERDYTFFVELQDLLGNRNVFTATNNPAVIPVRIDRVAPTCDLVAPTLTTLNASQVPGGTLTVTVGTSADVGMSGVTASLGMTSLSGTPMGASFQASIPFTNLTGTNTRTLDVTCRDLSGNPTAIPQRSLNIDLDAPTCAFTAPTASTTYTDLAIPTSLTVTGGDGRTVTISSTVGGTRGTLTAAAGVASGSITYANGLQDLSASLTDAAGNSGSCQVTAVNVNSADCGLAISNAFSNSNGLWFNRSNTGSLSALSGTATITAQTSSCTTGRMITLVRTAPTAGTPIVVADVAGTVTFSSVALNDDETWSISVPNGARPATVQTFRVDLDAPVFGVGPTQLGQARINGTLSPSATPTFFVAAADNRNVETAVAGYFADLTAGTAGAQVNLVLDGVQAFDFSLNGSVSVLFKGSPIASQSVTAANQLVSFTGGSVITLPHNDSGAFVVRVTDGAGNSSEWTSTATIDVIAPGAPSVSQTVVDARIAEAGLGWTPTYDDGSTVGSGGHAGYDVRWTTSSVPGGNNLATSTDFFGSAANAEANVAWSANPIVDRRVTLPPLNSYYIAVRARDEVGNYSQYAAPTALPNFWTQVTITAPAAAASANFAQTVVAAASINNDATADLVVTAPTKAGGGSVYVYYGASGFSSQSTCGTGCQELVPSDATAGQFGSDVSAGGNLGDLAGENKPDLVIGQVWTAAAPNNGGRAVIYFGTAGAAAVDTAQAIELRGDATNRIGSGAVRIIPSIDGDSLDELAISAPLFNANQGRIFIYRGRTRAQWASARTAMDTTTMVPFIPVSATTADYVVDGPSPLLVSPAGNAFGQNRFGLVGVGDISGDGRPDIAIPMSRSSINRYRIFSGAAIAASTGAAPLSAATRLLELTQATTTDNSPSLGLGAAAVGGLNFLDSTAPDLIVSYPGAPGGGRVFVYSGPVPMGSGEPAPVAELRGPLGFGTQVSAALLNGSTDTRLDLVSGMAQTTGNFAYVLYQQAGVRPFAGVNPGALGSTPEFWVSRFDAAVLSGLASSQLGAVNALADVDGNGQADVVLGDRPAGTVRIWR